MAGLVCTAVLVMSMLAFCRIRTAATHSRLRFINKKLNDLKIDLAEMDTDLHEHIDSAADSLRQELTEHFKQQIQEAKEELRRDESVPNIVSAHFDSQVRRLKKGQQNMKRQLQRVMESLRHVQQEKDLYRDAFFKADRRIAESCYKCASNSQLLSNVLKKSNGSSGKELFNSQKFNVTIVSQRFNLTNAEEIEDSFLSPLSTTTTTKISQLSTTTTTISPSASSATVQQTPVMNRLLTASVGESEMVQLNLYTGRSTKYSLHVPDGVTALCYIQRLQRLLVATYISPEKITSTSLDGDDTQTLREGVWVLGMAVDEGRELVFMTTRNPGYSISKMCTRGDNFTIIRKLTGGYRYPFGIAVNTRQREVYVSSYIHERVFSLSYDGKVLKTLVSADVWGVTFDSVSNTLYFHNGKTLKKISDGDVSDVTNLMKEPFTLAYYNNTVYYVGTHGTRFVGAVGLGEKIVETRLLTLNSTYNRYSIICLVP